ncbi:3-hydroxyacyl-CoA dehydrogenase family protein [Neofamilia massiliensis]|uniref:3-hydroxyacyl-CoA dehydrogenase family protein n=1 Tax=Neofamilia massiliensis TaxID=1673724 RepID=UPI0006BB82F4|nr:3-hydroxyacyl-CoA dehydrogenase family protein [Neofamilia massiliensis]
MTRELKRAAVIGGGVIGSSFTLLFAMEKMEVINFNRSKEGEERSKVLIENYIENLVEKEVIARADRKEILSKISFTNDLATALKNVDYVEEALPENYEVKKDFVKKFEEYADEDTILGSATSGLLITKIAEDAKHPERIFGAHPYNPPHLIPLIEISQGQKSDPVLAEKVKEMFIRLGKKPIIIKNEVPGFIANRLQALVMREIMDLVDKDVVSMEDAETALTFGPGIRWAIMGPGQIFHLGGGAHGLEGLLHHIGPSMESWLSDAATWTTMSESSKKKAVDGVKEAIKNRPKEKGNTDENLAKYRDEMLIEILKLHKKLEV